MNGNHKSITSAPISWGGISASGLRPLAKKNKIPDFSLTIINIVFLLLFFFIIAGSVVQRLEMETLAPATEALPLERLPRPLLVLTNQRELVLDGVPITLAEIKKLAATDKLKDNLGTSRINILADRDLPAVAVINIVDELNTADIAIKLVTIRAFEE